MKITQSISNSPTRVTLTPSRDFVFKLKGHDVYFASAFVSENITEAVVRELFDEVNILDVPRYIGALKLQVETLEAAGVNIASVSDEVATSKTPEWKPGELLKAGEARKHGDLYYRCLQTHTTQSDWMPAGVPALWKQIPNPESSTPETPAPWVQPTGAHDAYQKGDRVTFNGKVYESVNNNNAHSPSAYPAGWKEIK